MNAQARRKLATTVLRRFARAIRIDKSTIRRVVDQELAPQVKHWLKRHPNPDQPINGGYSVAETSFYIDSVDNERMKINVSVVTVKSGGKRYPVLGGSAGKRRWENGEATVQVVLNLNGALSPDDYLSVNDKTSDLAQFKTDRFQPLTTCTSDQCVPYGLYSILIHEVTHAAEAAFFKGLQYEYDSDHKIKDQRAYVNDPQEVRAFMQQVVDETVLYGEKLSTHRQGSALIDMCLRLSTTWKAIQGDLNTTNRKKILTAVYQAFQESGYPV